MIITSANSGRKANYSLSGTKLTIENQITIDLQDKERTVERVIDVCLDRQLVTIREGLGAWYVANIIIPPRRYSYQPSGEKDENDEKIMEEVELPVDPSLVELRLWGLPTQYFENEDEESEDETNESEDDE
ncbi:AAA family ATPase [Lentibacillus sp. N15]|uniref:AAA family ATPase n=1 Tax=Lentibacillus songyuanensis TaxID=3136161 RepID=UPI0031BAFA02